jgi:hypothetical protein
MLDILDNSAAKSGLISYKAPFVFRRDFTPTSPQSGCTRTFDSCWTPEKSWVYPYF